MKVSDFVGKIIKAIHRENIVGNSSSWLISFTDGSQIFADDDNLFFDGSGDIVENDIPETESTKFQNLLNG